METKRVLMIKDHAAIQAATRILKDRFPVAKVVLFGSKSRRDDDEESDIDILVLTSRPLSWRERDAVTDALYEVEMQYEVVISTLIVPRDEWEQGVYSVMPIHDEIASEGIVL